MVDTADAHRCHRCHPCHPWAHQRARSTCDVPCALAIGGLDPGGGAGLAADLRAFAAAGAFGCAVAAVLTVQSTAGLRAVMPLPAQDVTAQAVEVLRHQRVRAVKVGALGTAANVRAVARLLERREAAGARRRRHADAPEPGRPRAVDPERAGRRRDPATTTSSRARRWSR